jgi:hypothetical protein
MPLLAVFKNFLNDSTNVFKLAEISLNINKTVLYFLVFFYLFFRNSPGTLLPDLLVISTHNFGKSLSQQDSMQVLSENVAAIGEEFYESFRDCT